jgi:hypothetical protein
MLGKNHPLYFPKLQFIREGSLIRKDSGGESGRPINIYKLDWLEQEAKIKEKHYKWKKDFHPEKKLPFIGQLPEEWDEWIKSLVFAIDEGYMREIRHWTQQGLHNWNRSNYATADTMVREICLKPAISMIEVAFFLIGDCIYDPENSWYSRAGKNFLAEPVMLYKFWSYQTGRGLLLERARMEKIAWSIKNSTLAKRDPNDEYIIQGKKLIEDLNKHQEKFGESYKELSIDLPANEGKGE